MTRVYLGLGSNLGDKKKILNEAVALINERMGKVVALSSFYTTIPWNFKSDNTFLNAAAGVDTDLSPLVLLKITQEIERQLGRNHKSTNGVYHDRLIDIDILLYDDSVIQTEVLTIPHPLMIERRFVMEPLAEIAPEVMHPVYHQTIRELLR